MRHVLRVGIGLVALWLVGCGGRPLAPGKEAAAGALFQSSRGATGTPGLLAQLMNPAAGVFTSVKVSCPHGGQVAIQYTVDVTNPQASIAYDVVYDGCSFDGHTSQKGTLHMTYDVVGSTGAVQMALHLNGHVEYWGEISDHLDVDVTETVSTSDLTTASPTVSVVLNGTLSDSSGTYTFTNETVTIDGSGFTPAPDPKQG